MPFRVEYITYTKPDKAKGKIDKGSGIIRLSNHNIPSVARDGSMGINSSIVTGSGFCFPCCAVNGFVIKLGIPSSVPVILRIVSMIITHIGTLRQRIPDFQCCDVFCLTIRPHKMLTALSWILSRSCGLFSLSPACFSTALRASLYNFHLFTPNLWQYVLSGEVDDHSDKEGEQRYSCCPRKSSHVM